MRSNVADRPLTGSRRALFSLQTSFELPPPPLHRGGTCRVAARRRWHHLSVRYLSPSSTPVGAGLTAPRATAMSVMAATRPSLPALTCGDPIMSWLTSPLARKPTLPCGRGAARGKRRRCGSPPRTSSALHGVHGGDAFAPVSVVNGARSVASSPRPPPATLHHHPSATVVVPGAHAAWLTAASMRYNDGRGGPALNKTARNAVEWAAATQSVEAVLVAAAARRAAPLGGTGTAASVGYGRADVTEGGDRPSEDGDAVAAAAARPQPPAMTALPAQSVRLASAPLQFVDAVAARLSAGGAHGVGSAGDDGADRRSAALDLVLTAVRLAGETEVFTRRWGGGCDTASMYADVGVFAVCGGGQAW